MTHLRKTYMSNEEGTRNLAYERIQRFVDKNREDITVRKIVNEMTFLENCSILYASTLIYDDDRSDEELEKIYSKSDFEEIDDVDETEESFKDGPSLEEYLEIMKMLEEKRKMEANNA